MSSVRSQGFIRQIKNLVNSTFPSEELETRARDLINVLKDNVEYDGPPWTRSGNCSIKLSDILEAMIYHAFGCGGEAGRRYTVCAICACHHGGTPNNVEDHILSQLRDLATVWLSHLLFMFKVKGSHTKQQNDTPSVIATPILDDTTTELTQGAPKSRSEKFKLQLLKRDDYRCVVSGAPDISFPDYPEDRVHEVVFTQACHIIQPAIADFDPPESANKKSYLSALTTFDILRNYASVPIANIADFQETIHDPSNGITMNFDAHRGFDNFAWCLKATEVPNKYNVVYYRGPHGLHTRPSEITFSDHSAEIDSTEEKASSLLKRQCTRASASGPRQGISLPNPLYLRIHAAIAGILHMSGVGRFIDEVLRKHHNTSGSEATFTGDDFLDLVTTVNLRESVANMAIREVAPVA
ncbi:hypothetical protein SCP_0313360 [Sparassis crispa]|uniref:HNH nuclease domain-containing protein n=1 Tax=Sparassis crispa TaxID=139825 RepID=A0A401GHD6_9APHY|nr:hypothetical protein SCP_0313360 [Sparassis crispa]GBE81607.1 hypothetical protein SCP_0313360 [Sparassis crispa]